MEDADTHLCIEDIARGSFPIVQVIGSEVLATGRSPQMVCGYPIPTLKRIPLQPSHIRNCILAGQHGVLPRSLLPSSPSGVSKYVDVWCPICHSVCLSFIVKTSSFDSNGLQKEKKKKMELLIILYIFYKQKII